MEHIVREISYPQSEELIPPPKLPTYLRVTLILLTAFTVISLGTRALAQHTEPPPDPFAPFANMLPGQPGIGMEARGFTCYWESYDYSASGEHCSIDLATGTFTRVWIYIPSDRIIHYVTFTVRPNALIIGDLIASLGRPEIHHYGSEASYFWPSKGVMASTIPYSAGKFSLFVPVWRISFSFLKFAT